MKVLIERLEEAAKKDLTISDVTSFIKGMRTKAGGRMRDVSWEADLEIWDASPEDRISLDHYDDDMGEYFWNEEYANPLRSEVLKKLEREFGPKMFVVIIHHKGYVEIGPTAKGSKVIKP